jgi:hypothetical protein
MERLCAVRCNTDIDPGCLEPHMDWLVVAAAAGVVLWLFINPHLFPPVSWTCHVKGRQTQ